MSDDEPVRAQTACRLTVRFGWSVAADQHHPQYTFTCVEDEDMAVTAALRASEMAPLGIRFLGADVSDSGGRFGTWEPLDLTESA